MHYKMLKKQIVYNRLQYPKDEYNTNENRMINVYQEQRDSTRITTLNEFHKKWNFS